MNRRTLLARGCGLATLFTFGVLSQPARARTARAEKPNVIFILADDLGYGDIGPYGQKVVPTPNLDRLASEGMVFSDAYAGAPVCAPSRASLLLGRDTGQSPVRGNKEMKGESEADTGQAPLPPGSFTLATLFKSAGYKTAAIGKWGLGAQSSSGAPLRQGFDHYFGYLDQRAAHSYFPKTLWEDDHQVMLSNPNIPLSERLAGDPNDPKSYEKYFGPDYSQERIVDAGLSYIESNAASPFFLYLAFTLPHAALQVPRSDLDAHRNLEEKGPYLGQPYTPQQYPHAARTAMIARLDQDVGKVLAKLAALGLEKDTLVIFTSDNGPSGEGGSDIRFFNAAGGFRGKKRDVYEGGIRTPLIIRWPERIAAGQKSNQVCAFWDFMPTFAQLVHAKSPQYPEGVSILPVLLGQTQSFDRPPLYWEFHGQGKFGHSQAVRFGRWKAVRLYPIDRSQPPRTELFDLSSDAAETTDISALHPDQMQIAEHIMDQRSMSAEPAWNFDGTAVDED